MVREGSGPGRHTRTRVFAADAHRRPTFEPRRQEPPQPPALPAPREGRGPARRAGIRPREGHQGSRQGRPGQRAGGRRARAALLPPARHGPAGPYPARQQDLRGGRHDRAPAGRWRRARLRRGRGGRREQRGRVPLRPDPRGVPGAVPRGSGTAGPRQAPPRHRRDRGPAPGRLHGDRLARQPRAHPDPAQLDVAAHRPQAPEARGGRGPGGAARRPAGGRSGAAGPRAGAR